MDATRSVPFFNYPRVFTDNEEQFVEVFRDVGRRGAFIMQSDLRAFEEELADFTGAEYAIGVANATDALQLLLMASGISRGDEVIICSHTMIATAGAIHHAGAVPVPVETGDDHLIDYDSIESAITPRTKAIMPTQLNGRTANMDKILSIAERYDLKVFEDSAQALGSRFKGQHAGTFGVGGCISFYPAKVVGCFGDGGAVLTNDNQIYLRCLALRDHGRLDDGEISLWGLNSRLDNLHAAMLRIQLKGYGEVMKRRRAAASLYHERLENIDQIVLPPAPGDGDHYDIFQNFECEFEERDQLQAWLSDKGVGTLVQWSGKAVHQWEKLGFKQKLPRTDKLFQRMLMLPLNATASDEDYNYVCDCIAQFYQS